MLILGIETACDDTAAAVVEDGDAILSNEVWTQDYIHRRFGGVVPELAARRQAEVLNTVISEALRIAGTTFEHLDAVAVNCRHGLLRSIMVGVSAAKALAYCLSVPLIGIHHIEGHIYSNVLAHRNVEFPHICLTVAGGHTLIIHVLGPGQYRILGKTLDDSAGEVLDKVARYLGLGFPGGRAIDQLASQGDASAFNFPRPLLQQATLDFSFSGIKESARREIESHNSRGLRVDLNNFAASFQQAILDVLIAKALSAASMTGCSTITLAGGVSANTGLRKQLVERGSEQGCTVLFPPLSLCGDNGAMVACLAYFKLKAGHRSPLDIDALASAPLEQEVWRRA